VVFPAAAAINSADASSATSKASSCQTTVVVSADARDHASNAMGKVSSCQTAAAALRDVADLLATMTDAACRDAAAHHAEWTAVVHKADHCREDLHLRKVHHAADHPVDRIQTAAA
jgi:hypothetical protein